MNTGIELARGEYMAIMVGSNTGVRKNSNKYYLINFSDRQEKLKILEYLSEQQTVLVKDYLIMS